MEQLFYKCSSLTSLDLSKFDTSQVTTFKEMFFDCSKLKILNLSNFNIPKVSNMENMFSDCKKLEYINLKNAIIQSGSITMNNIFSNTALNLVFCTIDNLLIAKVKEKEGAIIDCTEKWKENRKRIIVSNNTCVDNCSIVFNTFEYDSKCYDNCPNGSYNYITFYSEDNYRIDCSNTLEGLYFDEKDSIYKLCYSLCKTCIKEGNQYNHFCLECKTNYFYQDNDLNYGNCYRSCSNYFYYDSSTKALHCTNNLACPINYNKFIFDKKQCIDKCENDINYKYEFNNECYIECPQETINNSFQCINISNAEETTEIIITTNYNIDELNAEETKEIVISTNNNIDESNDEQTTEIIISTNNNIEESNAEEITEIIISTNNNIDEILDSTIIDNIKNKIMISFKNGIILR